MGSPIFAAVLSLEPFFITSPVTLGPDLKREPGPFGLVDLTLVVVGFKFIFVLLAPLAPLPKAPFNLDACRASQEPIDVRALTRSRTNSKSG